LKGRQLSKIFDGQVLGQHFRVDQHVTVSVTSQARTRHCQQFIRNVLTSQTELPGKTSILVITNTCSNQSNL